MIPPVPITSAPVPDIVQEEKPMHIRLIKLNKDIRKYKHLTFLIYIVSFLRFFLNPAFTPSPRGSRVFDTVTQYYTFILYTRARKMSSIENQF